jgi:hypothetical protein
MRQGLDIADVERRTKIRAKYLRALENEEWGTLPGPTFVKTFLRTYADLVGVDAHLLVEEYRTNHDPGDDLEGPTRPGRPAATRRPPRRRPPPGPPSKLAVAAGLLVALLGFLFVLGWVSGDDEDPDPDRAAGDRTATETRARPTPKRPKPAPAPPKGVTVRLAPAAPTYACIDTGAGTGVVFEGILEGPRTFKNPNRLRLNLGKRAVDLRVNGKVVRIPPSPEAVGFDLTPGRVTEIPEGTRPCA